MTESRVQSRGRAAALGGQRSALGGGGHHGWISVQVPPYSTLHNVNLVFSCRLAFVWHTQHVQLLNNAHSNFSRGLVQLYFKPLTDCV